MGVRTDTHFLVVVVWRTRAVIAITVLVLMVHRLDMDLDMDRAMVSKMIPLSVPTRYE